MVQMQKLIPLITIILLSNIVIATDDNTSSKTYCYYISSPVCGEDGKTYQNDCLAKLANVNYSMGECKKTEILKNFNLDNPIVVVLLFLLVIYYIKNYW